MTVAVLGAGAFGTALAISLGQRANVYLWGRSRTKMNEMSQSRVNRARLDGVGIPDRVFPTHRIEEAAGADILLLAIPLQRLRSVLSEYGALFGDKTVVACCKGIELGTFKGPVGIIETELTNAGSALLTGPSFARDIAQGLPTALTLACADQNTAKYLQQSLNTKNLRLYTTTDVTGAELGGALKNVIAIACGVVIGAGLGESARAALMTRGFAEMVRVAHVLGADPKTLSGLSGLGDLALTCMSPQSRNYQYGHAVGSNSGKSADETVEGVATARAVAALAAKQDLDLPVTQTVAALLDRKLDVSSAIHQLKGRPLKEE